MGNYNGKLWYNPEDDLIRNRFDPDFIPPPIKPHHNDSPLYRPHFPSDADLALDAQARATSMDCLTDTLSFAKWPTLVALGWGAVKAAAESKPDLSQYTMQSESTWKRLSRGIARELRYCKAPVIWLGGSSAMYALTSCAVAKMRGEDGLMNSAVAGSVTGLALGLALRDPNKMAIMGFYGAGVGAFCKYAYLDPRTYRPRLTYYELVEYRKRMFRPELQELAAKDGYIHSWLDPGLVSKGVTLPQGWPTNATKQ